MRIITIAVALLLTLAPVAARKTLDLDSASIADLNAAFTAGTLTSERLVQMSLARIEAYDRKGPSLHAVITVNPKALETARALDAERKAKGPRSPLHGIPVALKDNYDTADMPTTGGSLLLEGFGAAGRCVSGEAAACGRRRDRRQAEHVGVRVGRRAQLARRTAP